MNTQKCNNPTCEKELTHTKGRRKKKYCSAACKNKINTANYFERNKTKVKTIRISIEEYKNLMEQVEQSKNIKTKESKVSFKEKQITELVENSKPPKIKGESSLDYKIRLDEWIANKKATN